MLYVLDARGRALTALEPFRDAAEKYLYLVASPYDTASNGEMEPGGALQVAAELQGVVSHPLSFWSILKPQLRREESMDPSRKRLIIGLAVAAGIVLIFLAGYLPGSSRARRAAEESRQASQRLGEAQALLAKTQFDLEVARLRGRLGEVLHETNANNFGVAAENATAYFDGLRSVVNSPQLPAGSEKRVVLEGILARRDEISADLARADQGVKTKLADLYMQSGKATE